MVNHESLIKHLTVTGPGKFGLVSQQASSTAGILFNTLGDRMSALFSPEHGWFGLAAAGEKTEGAIHPYWRIPVHSLYGETRKPTPEMLDGLSRLVVDLQDIGVRCYTYLATLKLVLEAATDAGLPVTVLDRPIPLGGIVDGPGRTMEFASFVAPLDIPLCHGMTPGECAKYIVREQRLDLDLTVIKMKGWSHSSRNPWPNFVPPSPAIRSWDSAALYPTTVFTEAYPALDCDRDGPLAFRVLGAPWIEAAALLDDFSELLPSCGMGARPIKYRPVGGRYAGMLLDGLLFSIEQPDAFYPVTAGALVFASLWRRHRNDLRVDARPEWMDKLTGSTRLRESLHGDALNQLLQTWIEEQEPYLEKKVDLYC